MIVGGYLLTLSSYSTVCSCISLLLDKQSGDSIFHRAATTIGSVMDQSGDSIIHSPATTVGSVMEQSGGQ